MGRWKERAADTKKGWIFWGIFSERYYFGWIFVSSNWISSSFTILVGSSYLTYLMISKVNGNRGTHQQRLWVVLLPRPHPKTLIGCITVASRAHTCLQQSGNNSILQKKKGSNARYWWWTKSCTTKDDDYPTIHRILSIPGGAGFLPSTVSPGLLEDGLSCIHIHGISARWMWFPLSCF